MKKILAVASGGGHWQQLMRVSSAFEGHEVVFVTTMPGLLQSSGITSGKVVADCNQKNLLGIAKCALEGMWLCAKVRPNVVISTGAAPGFIFLIIGRLFGAKTIWIDSVANAERLSMSGKYAATFAHLCLTQWEHLQASTGARYEGQLL